MAEVNRRWLLARHPDGMPDDATFRLEEAPVPEPGPGEIVVRAHWLSVDPYMRGRIARATSYARGLEVGEVMTGGGVGRVVASNHPRFEPGDMAECFTFGWQDYARLKGEQARKVDPALAPVQTALGVLGMPGLSAYFAFLKVGRPKPGDTVLVSAAAGAVGQVVGQLAKLRGCRAVAVASSDDKLAWAREIGFDAGINYRTAGDLAAAVAEACPNGVDIYFENVGGPLFDAAVANIAIRGRIVLCGMISRYNDLERPDVGPRPMRQIQIRRARMEGFLVSDWAEEFEPARRELADWYRDGRLTVREDVMEGLEAMPAAFLRLLRSENFGKQLVKVAAMGSPDL